MQENNCIFPHDIRSAFLTTLHDIKFTKREIDIIACILNGRTAKGIAQLLSISPKTAEAHTYNVMKKLECTSRENLIAVIERSDKLVLLKKYYLSLLTFSGFEKSLKDFSKLTEERTCLIVCIKNEENLSLLYQLKAHLELAGIKVSLKVREKQENLSHLIDEPHSANYTLYALPKSLIDKSKEEKKSSQTSKKISSSPTNNFFLSTHKEIQRDFFSSLYGVECISLARDENYYFSVFNILKKFFPHHNFNLIITSFKEKYKFTPYSSKLEYLPSNLASKQSFIPFMKKFVRQRKWFLFRIFLVCGAILILATFKVYEQGEKATIIQSQLLKRPIKTIARSDLCLPNESILLSRSELIAQIDQKLKDSSGIQTIAIIGPGGSGKTTLVRLYARKQRAPIIWEINAETQETLREAFNHLAQILSKTEEDQDTLRTIEDVKNPIEKRNKIIQFVKEHLKFHSHWFLIYDNVEKFSDIQKYFPQDPTTWGEGKVFLTTRNNSIQNNKFVNSILSIGELSLPQKLSLYLKIMSKGNINAFTLQQTEEVKKFLENIPSFPLDVSIAAYYLNINNITYGQYLKYLNDYNQEIENAQEDILKEVGDYTKTRYQIITLSLQQIMASHKDFKDLLLFISLFDSQNIPRDLLNSYKDKIIVDNFIHHLKKYSLITHELSSSLPVFSIHRSTQAIALTYLTKTLNLEKNKKTLEPVISSLEKYMADTLEKPSILLIKLFVSHCEVILNHKNLLSNLMKNQVKSELGRVHLFLGNYLKAQELLEESYAVLKELSSNDYQRLARVLSYIGIMYRVMGDYEKAEKFLEQALAIYKGNITEPSTNIAMTSTFLGEVYRELGHYEKARNLLEESLAIYDDYFPDNKGDGIPRALIHLGVVYRDLGEYKKAKNFLEKGNLIFKTQLADIGVAMSLTFLGDVYRRLGNYQKSQEAIIKALEIYQKVFAKNHLSISRARAYLGNVYIDLGNYKKAKELIKKSLIIYEHHFGKSHVATAPILKNLGHAYLLEGNLKTAETLLRKALGIFQRNKHPESFTALESLADLHLKKSMQVTNKGNILQSQNFKKQAVDLLNQALKVVKTHFPADSPHIMRIQKKIKNLEQE